MPWRLYWPQISQGRLESSWAPGIHPLTQESPDIWLLPMHPVMGEQQKEEASLLDPGTEPSATHPSEWETKGNIDTR